MRVVDVGFKWPKNEDITCPSDNLAVIKLNISIVVEEPNISSFPQLGRLLSTDVETISKLLNRFRDHVGDIKGVEIS